MALIVATCIISALHQMTPQVVLQIDSLSAAVKVTAESETYCSPLYRPPELYNCPHKCQLDGRIDVWALGCLLYFMMMGINPIDKQCQEGASMVLAVHKCVPSLDARWWLHVCRCGCVSESVLSIQAIVNVEPGRCSKSASTL
jgi:serine/threonine protein kinase